MFLEFRQYRTHPGQRVNWVKYMDEVIIPFQMSKGMVIVGSFMGEQEQDLYVWMGRWESEIERERLYEAVYQSDEWLNNIGPKIPEMLDRDKPAVVTRIQPTAASVRNSLVSMTISVATVNVWL